MIKIVIIYTNNQVSGQPQLSSNVRVTKAVIFFSCFSRVYFKSLNHMHITEDIITEDIITDVKSWK